MGAAARRLAASAGGLLIFSSGMSRLVVGFELDVILLHPGSVLQQAIGDAVGLGKLTLSGG